MVAALILAGTLMAAAQRAAGQTTLELVTLAPGTRIAGTGTGELITWEPDGHLTRWSTAGARLGTVSTTPLKPIEGSLVAARAAHALLCLPEDPGVVCRVVATRSGQMEGSFIWDEYPVRNWPADDGWMLGSAPASGMPRVLRWTLAGSPRGEVVLPAAELEELGQHLKVAVAALSPRLFAVRGTLWAIPAGRYEFWRLGPEPLSRVSVPPCRRVEGYHFGGEEARRRMAEYFSCTAAPPGPTDGPDAELQKIMSTLPPPNSGAAPGAPAMRTFVAAVGRVAVSGSLVAVRIEPPAAGEEARVDVWNFTGSPRLVGDAIAPRGAWEPIEVSRDAVWVACQHSVRRVPVRDVGQNPCGGTSP